MDFHKAEGEPFPRFVVNQVKPPRFIHASSNMFGHGRLDVFRVEDPIVIPGGLGAREYDGA
jgi:hypothetical protein